VKYLFVGRIDYILRAMTRPLRLEFPNALYHVKLRENAAQHKGRRMAIIAVYKNLKGTFEKPYFIIILRYSKKYSYTYQLYAAAIFFVLALTYLKIRIFRGILTGR